MTKDEIKKVFIIAADGLDIAADWNVPDVQVYPPKEWNLVSYTEDVNDGWCATRELAKKLRELSEELTL